MAFKTRVYATKATSTTDGHGMLEADNKDKFDKEFKDKFGEDYSIKAFSRGEIRQRFTEAAAHSGKPSGKKSGKRK